MNALYEELVMSMDALIDEKEPVVTGLSNASALIYQTLSDLNWSGFYMVRGNELVLGPFQGKVACTRIGKGKGVCGTSWATGEVQRVEDVHAFPGHIACDCASASEIVLPIRCGSRIVGVLDIDSPVKGRFTVEDQTGLEAVVEILEKKLFAYQQEGYIKKKEAPIGVLDSGVGGISVLKEIVKLMPKEDCLYYGDSAHAPYGTKSVQEVQRLTFACARELLGRGVKALVVACNTATSAAIARLREQYDWIPIIGIEPALKPAAAGHTGDKVLVMATPMTLREDKFHNLMRHYSSSTLVVPISCEGLMEFVERGILDGPELEEYLRTHLEPHLPADSIVLGCTHYPFVKNVIKRIVGENTMIWDGGEGTAREVKRRLEEEGLLREEIHQGKITFLNSTNCPEVQERCRRLLDYGD